MYLAEWALLSDPSKDNSSIFNMEQEIQFVRAEIRASRIFSQPTQPKPLISLDGKPLHPELVNMHLTLISIYDKYKRSQAAALLTPVYVTPSDEMEYHDVSNWTKDIM